MRTWLIVLLIALLPLRAWVGEAMAGEMLSRHAAMAAAGKAAVAATPAPQVTTAAHDCMGHGQAAAGPADSQAAAAASAEGDCPTCASCQACSSVALAVASPVQGSAPFGAAPPAAADLRFASAEPAPVVKPPIS